MPDRTISKTYVEAKWNRLRDAYCDIYGYQAKLPDGTDNPENKNQFTERWILKTWPQQVLRDSEQRIARKAADASVPDNDLG